MGHLELMQEEWNRINDKVKSERTERGRFRNDNATEMALQQRIATLQAWMDGKGYDINITGAIENQFNEFEFVHQKTIESLEDAIEGMTGQRPNLGE